ncbi:MAG TPA: hypothetical protein EYH36_05320 [Desulfocapsa sulfexigens]|nr:hypothetical protein [Desulfocapsa sulfexigens]
MKVSFLLVWILTVVFCTSGFTEGEASQPENQPEEVAHPENKPEVKPAPDMTIPRIEIPAWYTARNVMRECYAGWNMTVSLKSGAEYRQDMNEYTDENVYTILGEQTDTDTTSTSNSTYGTDKAVDSEYSRDRSRISGFVGLNMTVPLYSRKLRLARKESTNKQIEHLADLYANFEVHRATMAALTQEKSVLKKVMIDSGQQGITAYYQLLKEVEKERALMKSSARKILAILENCDYVATDQLVGTR